MRKVFSTPALTITLILASILGMSYPVYAINGHANDITLQQGGASVPSANQCTSLQPCSMQLYSMVGSCPATIGAGTWVKIAPSIPASTTTSNGSTFTYTDATTTSGQITCYYATVTFNSGGAASLPSNMFSGTTPTDTPNSGTLSVVAH